MSEYKPGTVAAATAATNFGAKDARVFRTDDLSRPWVSESCEHLQEGQVTDIRPLVVLDLSADERECLVQNLRAQANHLAESTFTTATVAFLREVADQVTEQTKPPKPEEPTGLGAVVEDAEGKHWLRIQSGNWADGESFPREYSRIDAVIVRDEGWKP